VLVSIVEGNLCHDILGLLRLHCSGPSPEEFAYLAFVRRKEKIDDDWHGKKEDQEYDRFPVYDTAFVALAIMSSIRSRSARLILRGGMMTRTFPRGLMRSPSSLAL
jgi:hypothetical protein